MGSNSNGFYGLIYNEKVNKQDFKKEIFMRKKLTKKQIGILLLCNFLDLMKPKGYYEISKNLITIESLKDKEDK